MAPKLIDGQRSWSLVRDAEAHRDYEVIHLVECLPTEGPFTVLDATPGLPQPGSSWQFDDDDDPVAQCTWEATVTPLVTKEPNSWFEVKQRFTTKPSAVCIEDLGDSITDPILAPVKISGTFAKYQEEALKDRLGAPITNSGHEQYRGPTVEFDANRPTVRLELNVDQFDFLVKMSEALDTVNDLPLWGFPARCIKLSNAPFEKRYIIGCSTYYHVTLEFDVFVRINELKERVSGFDRDLLDEGTLVLSGHPARAPEVFPANGWILDNIDGAAPDPNNPNHFIRYKDRNEEAKRIVYSATASLKGQPAKNENDVNYVHLEKYSESNFHLLSPNFPLTL